MKGYVRVRCKDWTRYEKSDLLKSTAAAVKRVDIHSYSTVQQQAREPACPGKEIMFMLQSILLVDPRRAPIIANETVASNNALIVGRMILVAPLFLQPSRTHVQGSAYSFL